MPHSRKERKKAFTLIELAIVLVIIGLIAVLIFPAITDFIKFGKKTEAKDFVAEAKDKIIGYALMSGKCLPLDQAEFEAELGVSVDPYGQKLFYYAGSQLDCESPGVGIDGATGTDLTVRKVELGGGVTTYDDIAFVIASTGRNVHQEFEVVKGSTTVTIYDPRQWPSAPGYGTGEYDEYDDIVEYVSLAYLKNKVGTNTAMESFEPKGADVSFNKNIGDFNKQDIPNPPGQDSGAVTVNVEEGTVELGGGEGTENEQGCLWYQGDNAEGNCTNGLCEINYGLRAYFTFKFEDVDTSTNSRDHRAGFTFAVIDGDANVSTACGDNGGRVGYAGTMDGEIINPEKMAVEIDTTPQNADFGTDFMDPDNNHNHIAFVYWANNRNNDVVHGVRLQSPDPGPPNQYNPCANPPCLCTQSNPEGLYAHPSNVTWLEDGIEHTLRIEIYRDSTDPATVYNGVFNSTVWIDCTNCTDLTLPWNTTYGTYQAVIHHNCTVGDNATDFRHMRFGWTEATGGEAQNIIISDFGVKFLNNTPNHQY